LNRMAIKRWSTARLHLLRILAGGVALSALSIMPAAHSQTADAKLNDAVRQWEAVQARCSSIDLAFRSTETTKPGEPPLVTQGFVLRNDKSLIFGEVIQNARGGAGPIHTERILGRNPEYVFMITRKGPSGPHVPTFVGQSNESFEQKLTRAIPLVYAPICVHGSTMIEWLKKPGFTVRGIEEMVDGGRPLMRIDATYTPAGLNVKEHFPDMRMLVDPRNSWCLDSASVSVWYGVVTTRWEYRNNAGIVLSPSRVLEQIAYNEPGKKPADSSVEFTKWLEGPIPPESFLLSSFGIAEPEYRNKRGEASSGWKWVLAMAAGLALVAMAAWKWGSSSRFSS